MLKKETLLSWLPLGILLFVALFMRCWTLFNGTNVDEGFYILHGREWLDGHWPYRDIHLNKTPLVSVIALPFFVFFDTPIIPIRLFILGLSMASIVAVYYIGRTWVTEHVGLLAAGFYAFDPLTIIWAKYLHVSTLAPILSACALGMTLFALRKKQTFFFLLAGGLAAVCLLNKQTSVILLPVVALLLFIKRDEIKKWDFIFYFAGLLSLPLMLLMMLVSIGAVDHFLYDIWWGNLAMWKAFDFTLHDRWITFRAFMHWNPLMWWGVIVGVIALAFKRDRLGLVLCAWFSLEFVMNIYGLSHVWKHYILAIVPACALITGYGGFVILNACVNRFSWRYYQTSWISLLLVFLLTVPYWPRANWNYPNITLQDERALAAQIKRRCTTPYLLCLANSTFYLLTDKQVPPAIRNGEKILIPPFMSTAGRYYLTLKEMEQTVDYWRQLPVDYCVMYGKHARQIFVERDPHLEPLRLFLEEEFEQAPVLRLNRSTYMATLYCFQRKDSSS